MSRLREWVRRLAGTFRRGRSDRDLEEELRVHAQMAAEGAARNGAPAEATARVAAIRHGQVAQAMQSQRDQRGLRWMADLGQDVRYAWRGLLRNRTFSVVVILSLALGIGANTAIFSLVNALMLRSLPVRAPGQLVSLWGHYPGDPRLPGVDWASYERFRDQNQVFSDFVGTSPVHLDVSVGGPAPDNLLAEYVVGGFFPTLGLRPAIGRLITNEDDRLGAADVNVVVLSWSYWQHHFGLDPGVLGRQIRVAGVSASVIGVTPRSFTGILNEFRTDLWMPTAMSPLRKTGGLRLLVVGRLKASVSMEQARADVSVINQPIVDEIAAKSHDPKWHHATMDVEPAGAGISLLRDTFAKPVLLLMAGASLLLLLACINIASVLLARGVARQREMSVRIFLGAGRFRLVRQVFTESLLLGVVGSAIAVWPAYFGADALLRVLVATTRQSPIGPLQIDVRPDGAVLLFTAAIGLSTAILFGLVPAWQAFSLAPASFLREIGGAGEPRSRRLFGKGLVVAQVALSAVLLSTAGLLAQYLSDLRHVDLGFNRQSILLVTLNPRGSHLSAAQLTSLYEPLLDRLHAIPGVRSATLSMITPIPASGVGWSRFARVEGFEEPPENRRYLSLNAVAPHYFATLGTPLLAGRDFDSRDGNGPPVAILNQATARYYFADRSPLGRHLTFEGEKSTYEIVGVVADAKTDLHQAAARTVYLDAFQEGHIGSEFALRTDMAPNALIASVRQVFQDLAPRVPVQTVTTLADQMDASLVLERTIATLAELFAALGVLLAALGLYGLLAYTVTKRTSEIGVRMALGATEDHVMRMVLTSALAMVGFGLVLGTPVALWSRHLATTMIEGLPMHNPLPLLSAVLAMIVIALVSAYLPARRAARVRPIDALRHE